MKTVNWLEELSSLYPPVPKSVKKSVGRPVGSKNKEPKSGLTKEQWMAAYWKLRRQYRQEQLSLKWRTKWGTK